MSRFGVDELLDKDQVQPSASLLLNGDDLDFFLKSADKKFRIQQAVENKDFEEAIAIGTEGKVHSFYAPKCGRFFFVPCFLIECLPPTQ